MPFPTLLEESGFMRMQPLPSPTLLIKMHILFSQFLRQVDELGPFFESLRKVPKSGVHNPLKKPERYVEKTKTFCVQVQMYTPDGPTISKIK
jgi:hypothetical protein